MKGVLTVLTFSSEVAFSFMKALPNENYVEAKKRIEERGTEILQGINCSVDEMISLKALYKCKAKAIFIGDEKEEDKALVFSDLTKAERELEGNDITGFLNVLFFAHIDEEEYRREKGRLWDEVNERYLQGEIERDASMHEEDELQTRIIDEETLIKQGTQMLHKRARNNGAEY